ncbi:hypothetical protein G7Y89_g3296 [Cudoniella acicularis]|uniref:Uncharacterized protein n=1 Tax=Cudoniella acicularis TaxID=354080 RepID=A0A8H4RRN1_9HELO|nr:hypothetical protein G7Y89_g3296 [Cudoniella acicularis]
MAFRQPTYHAPQRIYTAPNETQNQQPSSPLTRPLEQLADSQEWVLFSPSAASTTDHGYTNSTVQTRTAGRSRISDLGSLDTAARSYGYDLDDGSEQTEGAGDDEEDGELDSLDSHLHEFGAQPSVYRSSADVRESGETSGTVLPTHDGLGSFRVDQTLMGEEVQEHLYAFEKYNPRRVKRRRESVELGILELENERAAEAERTRRIEKWRMEQSRLLVDEIQKETRRRKQSLSSERPVLEDREQEDLATLSTVESSTLEEGEVASDENESFWNRITKRVIQDLMGIDDDLLSIIFGEAIPENDDLSTTPPANQPLDPTSSLTAARQLDVSSWEYRLLERIARELGILVNQLSDHPGAFSTYLHSQKTPLPYAGLPVIPETSRVQIPAPSGRQLLTSTLTDPQFLPTIPQVQPLPISSTSLAHPSPLDETDTTPRPSPTLSREEWEKELDIKMVFRYLRSRITSKFHAHASSPTTLDFTTSGTSHLATASTADSAARAARVRQHHPLVTRHTENRRRSIERRTWKPTVPGTSGVLGGGIGARRPSSSCASVSAKRNSGSSRHYWDFGAGQSVGSGSLIANTGGMGSWGEV